MDLQSIAIMLELVRPAGTAGRVGRNHGQAGLDEGGRRIRRPTAGTTQTKGLHFSVLTPRRKAGENSHSDVWTPGGPQALKTEKGRFGSFS